MTGRLVRFIFHFVSGFINFFAEFLNRTIIRVARGQPECAKTEQNCNKWLFHFRNSFISQPPERRRPPANVLGWDWFRKNRIGLAHNYAPPPDDPEIVHADDWLIVIDKPSGLLSVPGRGPEKADCAITRIQKAWPDALTVHRLDMSTSGLLLFARSKDAQRELSRQFEAGRVEKTYIADVWGRPDSQHGLVDLPLITDWPNRPRQKVDREIGKPSQTRYLISQSSAVASRMSLTPLTGRSHQLRVHMAELGHPILGDELYAHDEAEKIATRLHLHAAKLAFTHPQSGSPMRFQSPCPFNLP